MGWQWHQLDHKQIICTSLQRDNHASISALNFYRPEALPDVQPTVSKHWKQYSVAECRLVSRDVRTFRHQADGFNSGGCLLWSTFHVTSLWLVVLFVLLGLHKTLFCRGISAGGICQYCLALYSAYYCLLRLDVCMCVCVCVFLCLLVCLSAVSCVMEQLCLLFTF